MSRIKDLLSILAWSSLLSVLLSLPCLGDSQVRIVRLSTVEGKVQVDRGANQGFEKAFLNLPITQGMALRTDIDGAAEVEFEDGSTLRMTPGTQVRFSQLSLLDSGTKASTVHVKDGTVYVSFGGAKDSQFNLTFARHNLQFSGSAHVRLQMEDADAVVSVFKGEVSATSPKSTLQVSAKHTATFDLIGEQEAQIQKNTEYAPDDGWDKQQQQYHDRYASASYSDYSP